ncbi:hypothetical protein [Flavobacterium sp.]|uniref:hypothetical protein n=1 Tax=Flavobacterium sp. TaxID=239 RepID=UPI0025C0D5EC|nr:hypothetical protein [Flavobacterium sp.]
MRKCFFLILVVLINSCESVENNSFAIQSNYSEISGYKVTINSQSTDANYPYTGETIINGVVQNGKLLEINNEFLLNGVSQGLNINSSLDYQDGLLVSYLDHLTYDSTSRVRKFYYDENSKLVGSKLLVYGEEHYYRFNYLSENVVYFEKITLPYNDSNAQIIYRNIAVFDGDDIIQAGNDINLDGVMDQINNFQYSNGDLVLAYNDNETLMFNYSNVMNNMNILLDNSYGKKNKRIICIGSFSYSVLTNLPYFSNHLLEADLASATYEVYPSTFFHTKTVSQTFGPPSISFNGTSVETTEFFFN